MKNNRLKFDEEELQILRDFERGEFESIRNFREEKGNWRKQRGIPFRKTNALISGSHHTIWRESRKEQPKKVFPIRP